MKKIFYFFIILLGVSCSEKPKEINQNLIYFDSDFLAEFGDDNYDKLEVELNSKIKAKYIDKIIYVSKTIELITINNTKYTLYHVHKIWLWNKTNYLKIEK